MMEHISLAPPPRGAAGDPRLERQAIVRVTHCKTKLCERRTLFAPAVSVATAPGFAADEEDGINPRLLRVRTGEPDAM